MNLDYLVTYRQVVESGSFSEVVKRLSISQPAVSFQPGTETGRALGMRLIDQVPKSITMKRDGNIKLTVGPPGQEDFAPLVAGDGSNVPTFWVDEDCLAPSL